MSITVDFANNTVEFVEEKCQSTGEIAKLVIGRLKKLGFYESGKYSVEFVGITFLVKKASKME